MACEIDERSNEETVVGRTREILRESAVDLDEIKIEISKIAKRGVAGAKIVHGDSGPELLEQADDVAGARPVDRRVEARKRADVDHRGRYMD